MDRRFLLPARRDRPLPSSGERLTLQTWELIGRLEDVIGSTPERRLSAGEIVDVADEALNIIAALSGLFDENFNRGAGWVFYVIGRCVERGVNTCRLLPPVRR